LAACREEAGRLQRQLVEQFADRGVSGEKFALAERPEGARLVAACEAGEVDVVLVRDLDRLGRDAIETLTALRDLTRIGVRVHDVDQHAEQAYDKSRDRRDRPGRGTRRVHTAVRSGLDWPSFWPSCIRRFKRRRGCSRGREDPWGDRADRTGGGR
jgi:Resolvase, N terminal domain